MKIREIDETDLPAVIALFADSFRRRPRSYWQRGFENMRLLPSIPGQPRYGYLLDSDDGIQAALLLLSTKVHDNVIRTNLSTWCARPAYRSVAILLHTRALKQQAQLYVNLSPATNVEPILHVSGFSPYTNGVCLLDPRAAMHPSNGYLLTRYDAKTGPLLPRDSAIIADRHQRYGCSVLVLQRDSEWIDLLIYRLKWIKGILPCAQMMSGAPEKILTAAGPLMRHLLKRGIATALVDITEHVQMLGARSFWGRNRRYVKGPWPAVGDMLDSEFALFGP
jgi:hypothetical protein